MMDSLELYSETILDHYQYPRHVGTLAHATARVKEHNTLCGDVIELVAQVRHLSHKDAAHILTDHFREG